MKKTILVECAVLTAVVVFSLAIVMVPIVSGRVDEYHGTDNADFDSARWKWSDLEYRYSVVELVVGSPVVNRGMTRDEVEEILGRPEHITRDEAWSYESQRPGYRVLDFSGGGVIITFDSSGLVATVSDSRWSD